MALNTFTMLVFFFVAGAIMVCQASDDGDCKQIAECVHFPYEVCVDSMVQQDCPILCKKCGVEEVCGDVSSHCTSTRRNCNRGIYQRRCRKSCNLCDAPLPVECKGKMDKNPNCPSRAANGECRNSSMMKDECTQSCCLRKEL